MIVIVGPPEILSIAATATVRCISFCHAEGARAFFAGRGAGIMVTGSEVQRCCNVVVAAAVVYGIGHTYIQTIVWQKV